MRRGASYNWICRIANEQNREGSLDRVWFVCWIIIPIHGEAFIFDAETIASKNEAHIDVREIRQVRQLLEFCFKIWEGFIELALGVSKIITSKMKTGDHVLSVAYHRT
jgi:hypothetical protein